MYIFSRIFTITANPWNLRSQTNFDGIKYIKSIMYLCIIVSMTVNYKEFQAVWSTSYCHYSQIHFDLEW